MATAVSEVVDYLSARFPALLDVLHESDVCELELEEGAMRLRVRRTPTLDSARTDSDAMEMEAIEPQEAPKFEITSTLVGTFYRASTPEMQPFISEGSHVQPDTVVGIVEALHVLTEIEAGCSGVVTDVHVIDGQPVEYGQILFGVTGG